MATSWSAPGAQSLAKTLTMFASLLQGVGLSQREAAAFLGVQIKTLGHWCSGHRKVPPGACDELLGLACREERGAATLAAAWPADRPVTADNVWSSVAAADWPSEGAALAVARRAWERLRAGHSAA